jgi:RecA-family ATPase
MDIAAAFATAPPPLDFVLPGMLAGTVGALVSPGGAGKSMFALQLGILVACGSDLAGIGNNDLATGRTVLLAAEDPEVTLAHRLHGIGAHLSSHQRNAVNDYVSILPLHGHGFDIMTAHWYDWVLDLCDGTRLLVVDTLRRIHTLDENSSSQMSMLLTQLERITLHTGCTILFLHHSSKASAMQGQGDIQQASRGSSVLVDNIRWQSYMATMTRDEAARLNVDEKRRGLLVRWGVSKQNYGKPVAECWLQRHEGGVLLPIDTSITNRQRIRKSFDE